MNEMNNMNNVQLIRCEKLYTIEEVLSKVLFCQKSSGKNSGIKSGKHNKVDFDGHQINMASDRYKTFATHGIKCIKCGIEGQYFAMERHECDAGYHFNLYAIDSDGVEILMTKDHIIPKALGGLNRIDNYQTMCLQCNNDKQTAGLTLEQWQSIPISRIKVSAVKDILHDWEMSLHE